jgi:hypothetical protein
VGTSGSGSSIDAAPVGKSTEYHGYNGTDGIGILPVHKSRPETGLERMVASMEDHREEGIVFGGMDAADHRVENGSGNAK